MSSIIRGASSQMPGQPAEAASHLAAPVARGRLIRGESVGMHRPIPIEVRPAVPAEEALALEALEEELPVEPPPDVEELREAARTQGYDEGYEQGYETGLAAAEERMKAQVERLGQLAATVLDDHSAFCRAAERQVVDLALQIAQKVIEREVENVPDLAVGVIRAALEEMDGRTAVRIHVSPEDHELLRRRWAMAIPSTISANKLELVVDPRVQGGGAIIETTQGQVDTQLETRLAQLGNALWSFTASAEEETDSEPGADA